MRTPIVLALMLSALASGAARAQRPSSVLGRRLDLTLVGSQRLSGELLAVERDSLWLLLSGDHMRAVPLGNIMRAQVPARGLTAGGVLVWTLVGGLVSGGLLTAACNSVDGSGCEAVFPAVFLSWGVVGGLSAAAMSGSRAGPVRIEAGSLRPYARFPQGLPDRFAPATTPSTAERRRSPR